MCTGPHAFIPAADTVKVELRLQQDNQLVENVFWVNTGGVPSSTDLANILGAFNTWYNDHLRAVQANNVLGRELIATDWTEADGQFLVDPSIVGATGTGGADAMPNETTLAIHWDTGFRGRSKQGHTDHVGLTGSRVNQNTVLPAAVLALLSAYSALPGLLTAAGYTLVVASFCHNKVWRTTALTTPVTGASVKDSIIDSQRRRKPGVGR